MSVGHIARAFEEAKIATVIIASRSFETRMEMMSLPRVLVTSELVGRPLGDPFDNPRKEAIIQTALMLLETAEQNKVIQHYKG